MPDIEARTMRKVLRRFVPLLTLCFVVAFLDRVNVGFAALTMNRDLGISASTFGLAAGLFFVSYFVFEVPSNILLERVGARRWIARIMFTWGLCSAATAFVQGASSFYTVRILLGAAEAGFFPGIVFFLTLWVPASYRARVIGGFMAAMPVASVIGSPLSGYLMSLDGLFGLAGWQVMFLIEAVPSLVLAVAVWKILCDSPRHAEWLSNDERNWLTSTLEAERASRAPAVQHSVLGLFRSPLVLFTALAYFGVTGFNYGMSFFLPQIVKGFDLTIRQVGYVSALPFLAGAIGMIFCSKHSDRTGERRAHLLVPLVLAVVGLAGSTLVTGSGTKLFLLCIASFGVFSALPVFWTIAPRLLGPATAAAGIALINSLGNLSGFVDPYAVGVLKDATGSFDAGMQLIAAFGALAIVILFFVTRGNRVSGDHPGRENAQAQKNLMRTQAH
ncbi:putative tartrate transporter [Paraburkholderia piptadeniae]|uniref:Tartrate transporter n=1 Tax=Paraburkholderia piptadeniae TaxID=1701573 RepID=A0A1N7SPT3_9BURK|nr:MFS transporter [Paraburkholderia piptadeniae]SIT49352.1 putative tartrate transporter [Paraburkholderia piptadeniae]